MSNQNQFSQRSSSTEDDQPVTKIVKGVEEKDAIEECPMPRRTPCLAPVADGNALDNESLRLAKQALSRWGNYTMIGYYD